MGSILTGDNADAPSPYDFAMGGAGMDPSLPVGADGSVIRPGSTVMVDMNGDFTGYMTDMTRTFRLGSIAPEAERAHELSRAICRRLAEMGRPGYQSSQSGAWVEIQSLFEKPRPMPSIYNVEKETACFV